MIIRNDDVAADTTLDEIRTFCEICDRYGATPMHAITPIGRVRSVDCRWTNAQIRERTGTALFAENRDVVEYLKARKSDKFAVHGLWHTHSPTPSEINAAGALIKEWIPWRRDGNTAGTRYPEYFVPPFNEGNYPQFVENLIVCGRGVPRLEEYLESGDPQSEIVYLHSWRFQYGPFTWQQLDKCLARLTRR